MPILSLKVGLAVMCSEKVQEKYRCEFIHSIYFAIHYKNIIQTKEKKRPQRKW